MQRSFMFRSLMPCKFVPIVICYEEGASRCDEALVIAACHVLNTSGIPLTQSCLTLLNPVSPLHCPNNIY